MAPRRCESDEGGAVRGSRRRFSLVLGSERRGAGARFVVQTVQRALYIPSRRTTGQEVGRPPGPLPGQWKGDWVTLSRGWGAGGFLQARRLLVSTPAPASPMAARDSQASVTRSARSRRRVE